MRLLRKGARQLTRMNGKYLLDTNIVIAIFEQDPSVISRLTQQIQVVLPAVVLGELYYGAQKSARVDQNTRKIDELAAVCIVLPADQETARRYGIAKNRLKLKGKPIPENDIWIAAVALEHELTLVTRDSHFQEVEDLKLEVW